ncbi:hypothetical protein [Qipengyuania sp.]|uniref:hypothetical protein n=1 Tax=Qipengyuania sp. TaxID=2004515 RepID=UPI0035126878
MPRRSSRPRLLPDDVELGEGWIRHDGAGCPVALDARPAILFTSGTRFALGTRSADEWEAFEEGSCWEWRGREASGFDILAYWPG